MKGELKGISYWQHFGPPKETFCIYLPQIWFQDMTRKWVSIKVKYTLFIRTFLNILKILASNAFQTFLIIISTEEYLVSIGTNKPEA